MCGNLSEVDQNDREFDISSSPFNRFRSIITIPSYPYRTIYYFIRFFIDLIPSIQKLFLQFSSIMLSSSSHFDKDCNSTQGFDLEQLAQSNFDFAQSIDEFDLEQSCLLRLKAQREKIEELTKLYQENEKELARRCEKEKEMAEQIEHLSDLSAYKEEYDELKREYETLSKRNELTESELVSIKNQLQAFATASGDESAQLKKEIKYLKEQRLLSDAHWEAILADKEEQLKKESRISQEKEYELCEQILKLTEKVESLEESLGEKAAELDKRKEEFRDQLAAREEDLVGFEKVVESFKKQNNEYKAKIVSIQDNFQREKSEYLEAVQQLRMQVKMLRKDQSDKENEIYQFKEMIKKCDTKNQALESTVNSLKTNLKKFKANTDTSLKKMSSTSEDQRARLQLFIHELKTELERQMQEKSGLLAEVKRLKGQIQRKQQQEKQRKLLLMTEFREIDKMQKMVNKII